jgi:hypothetical protein
MKTLRDFKGNMMHTFSKRKLIKNRKKRKARKTTTTILLKKKRAKRPNPMIGYKKDLPSSVGSDVKIIRYETVEKGDPREIIKIRNNPNF